MKKQPILKKNTKNIYFLNTRVIIMQILLKLK